MQPGKTNILSTALLGNRLVRTASKKGVRLVCTALIEVQAIQTSETFQAIKEVLMQSAVVVFTSKNAVQSVVPVFESKVPDWKIYCLGNTTSGLVAKYFGPRKIAGIASSALELAHLIAEKEMSGKVVFFCGNRRRYEPPGYLRSRRFIVDEIVVYNTAMHPGKITEKYCGILFFSPSAVQSFFMANPVPPDTVLFAIGATTAAELKKFSANKIIVSEKSGKENLLNKALEFFS